MASLAQSFGASERGLIFSVIGKAIAHFAEQTIATRSRRNTINCLENLSDDRLADIGINRENIAKEVFRDRIYL